MVGYSISWLMISGKDRKSLLAELGLEVTDNSGDFSDFELAGHALPDGAYLLVMGECDHPIVSEEWLAQVSIGCNALACCVEEHTMYAHVAFWDNGKNLWSLKHQGDTDEGRNDLIVSGAPPDSLSSTWDELAAKQPGDPDVDWYFEIPLVFAKRLSSFKHDEANPGLDGSFVELRNLRPLRGKAWWRFWRPS